MSDTKKFFQFVLPSVLSFALSGVYSIVDGYFIGNSIGDLGLSAVTIAYPIVALIQAIGTGIGMGGAIGYSIRRAEKNETGARAFTAGAIWLMLLSSVLLTFGIFFGGNGLLRLLGASGDLLAYADEYIVYIAIGAALQIVGTALVPFIRNHGGSFYAMVAMVAGSLTNIVLDWLFVWVFSWGMMGAALATVIGQGMTMLIALIYLIVKKQFTLVLPGKQATEVCGSIVKVGIAPFGLAMSPNISLIIINRFSVSYGGEPAIAAYAVIAYIISIIYMVFQGVGDGGQPLLSQCYGERDISKMKHLRRLAYGTAMVFALIGCAVMFGLRTTLGPLFGTSDSVSADIAAIIPIFLVSVPFVAICRVTTASFYATEKSVYSYLLTFIEPILMLTLMFILPPLVGGQVMIWWSTVFARVLSAVLALILKQKVDRQEYQLIADKS